MAIILNEPMVIRKAINEIIAREVKIDSFNYNGKDLIVSLLSDSNSPAGIIKLDSVVIEEIVKLIEISIAEKGIADVNGEIKEASAQLKK